RCDSFGSGRPRGCLMSAGDPPTFRGPRRSGSGREGWWKSLHPQVEVPEEGRRQRPSASAIGVNGPLNVGPPEKEAAFGERAGVVRLRVTSPPAPQASRSLGRAERPQEACAGPSGDNGVHGLESLKRRDAAPGEGNAASHATAGRTGMRCSGNGRSVPAWIREGCSGLVEREDRPPAHGE